MTEAEVIARANLTDTERLVVNLSVSWAIRAQRMVGRHAEARIGKGQRYRGPVADDVMSRYADSFDRWLAMSRCVRDIVRIRRGLPLRRESIGGWRGCTQWHDRNKVADLADEVGVRAAARKLGIQPNSVFASMRRARAA